MKHTPTFRNGQSVVIKTAEHGNFYGEVSEMEWKFDEWLYYIELESGEEMAARPWDMEPTG